MPPMQRQIASWYYPQIGPYASSDIAVIEWQLLLMKAAGAAGILIDWYGVQGTNGDIQSLLDNSNAIISRIGSFGLKFAVVLEDRFTANISQASANLEYLQTNYFSSPHYATNATGHPWLLVFGPITFETGAEWDAILVGIKPKPSLTSLWYESQEMGTNANGEYAWIYQTDGTTDHLEHTRNFYTTRAPYLESQGLDAIGAVYPGFHDYYAEAGAGPGFFYIPHNGGATLRETIALAVEHKSKVAMIQVATWNDYGEGTMVEPTLEFGLAPLLDLQAVRHGAGRATACRCDRVQTHPLTLVRSAGAHGRHDERRPVRARSLPVHHPRRRAQAHVRG